MGNRTGCCRLSKTRRRRLRQFRSWCLTFLSSDSGRLQVCVALVSFIHLDLQSEWLQIKLRHPPLDVLHPIAQNLVIRDVLSFQTQTLSSRFQVPLQHHRHFMPMLLSTKLSRVLMTNLSLSPPQTEEPVSLVLRELMRPKTRASIWRTQLPLSGAQQRQKHLSKAW